MGKYFCYCLYKRKIRQFILPPLSVVNLCRLLKAARSSVFGKATETQKAKCLILILWLLTGSAYRKEKSIFFLEIGHLNSCYFWKLSFCMFWKTLYARITKQKHNNATVTSNKLPKSALCGPAEVFIELFPI